MICSRGRPFRRITAQWVKPVCVVLTLCLCALPTGAVEFAEVQVFENGGMYHITMVTEVDAPAEYVYRVLTDYKHIYRINPSITESEILPSPGNGAVRIRTRVEGCILVFCMELDRVEDVHETSYHDLRMTMVPALSDFRSGNAKWGIEDMEEYAQVIYQAQIEPAFDVLPVIGTALVNWKLRQEVMRSIRKIECIAKIQEERDWNSQLQVAGVDVDAACRDTCDPGAGQCQP